MLDRRYGLDQGFLVYHDLRPGRRLERPAREVTAEALAALEQIGDRRFFLWAHYYDPHSPFEPPQPLSGEDDLAPEAPELYDREIAYMDHWIGELLGGLEERRLLDDTLVVVAGDHGESLGDHGETYHTLFVYDSTVHVPLILAGGELDQKQRLHEAVFPEGLTFDGQSFRTVVTSPLFSYLQEAEAGYEELVALMWAHANPKGFAPEDFGPCPKSDDRDPGRADSVKRSETLVARTGFEPYWVPRPVSAVINPSTRST